MLSSRLKTYKVADSHKKPEEKTKEIIKNETNKQTSTKTKIPNWKQEEEEETTTTNSNKHGNHSQYAPGYKLPVSFVIIMYIGYLLIGSTNLEVNR